MLPFEPYISQPGKPRLVEGCIGNDCTVETSVGPLRVSVHSEDGASRFLPMAFERTDGSASFSVDTAGPQIRVKGGDRALVLNAQGFLFEAESMRARPLGRTGRRTPTRAPLAYNKRNVSRLAKTLASDEQLRASLIGLGRDLWLSTMEYAAVTQTAPMGQLSPPVTNTGDQLGGATDSPAADACVPEKRETAITKTTWEFVGSITTALERLNECKAGCEGKGFFERPVCEAGCYLKGFVDLVVGAWEWVTRVVGVLVEWTLCPVVGQPSVPALTTSVPATNTWATSGIVPLDQGGRTPPDEVPVETIEAVLGPAKAVLECIAKGDWKTWHHDFNPELEGSTPIGVQVCFDKACADKIRNSLGLGTLVAIGGAISQLAAGPGGVAGLTAAVLKIAWLKPAIAAIAAAAGITLAEAAALLLGLFIILAYQAVAVAGQIAVLGAWGGLDRGVCLRHPSLLATAGMFLFPPAALSWPITVGRR